MIGRGLAAAIVLCSGLAQAAGGVVAVRATIATSERVGPDFRESALGAFDGDTYPGVFSRWCTADGKAKGQSVTVRFAAPERIDQATIYVAPNYAPVRALAVVADEGAPVPVVKDVNGFLVAKLGVTASSLTVQLVDVDESTGKHGCLTDVALARDGKRLTLVHGAPAAAASQLAAAVEAADTAAAACNPAGLGKAFALPLAYDYVGPHDGGEHAEHTDPAKVVAACKAGKLGRLLPKRPLDTMPLPGKVAAQGTDGHRWVFTWQDARWRVTRVEGAGKVNH